MRFVRSTKAHFMLVGIVLTLGVLAVIWLVHSQSEYSYCVKHTNELSSYARCYQFYQQ